MTKDERTVLASYKLLREGRISELRFIHTRSGIQILTTTSRKLEDGVKNNSVPEKVS